MITDQAHITMNLIKRNGRNKMSTIGIIIGGIISIFIMLLAVVIWCEWKDNNVSGRKWR